MGNPSPARGPSTIVNRTVTPRRQRNADLREREYLTPKEVERLQDAARKHSRYGHRDATAILIAYRHGLRASELCELTWNMIELDSGRIHVRRAKNGGFELPWCQRRSKTASACRSKNTSVMLARRVPELGAFSSDIMLGSDYPPACPSWHGVNCACSD
jgi:integrase